MKEKEVSNVSETYRNIVITSFWRVSVYSEILAGNIMVCLLCYNLLHSFQVEFVTRKKTMNNIYHHNYHHYHHVHEGLGVFPVP